MARRAPEATRAALVAAAGRLFAARGYHDTATEEVVRAAGLTRGALYHHFTSKDDLLRAAVTAAVEKAVVGAEVGDRDRADVWDGVVQGTQAYLDGCLDPAVARLLLVDGPAVLGLRVVVEIAEAAMGRRWDQALLAATEAGEIDPMPMRALGHLIAAMVAEAGVYVMAAADAAEARTEVGVVLTRVLEGLRAPAGSTRRDVGDHARWAVEDDDGVAATRMRTPTAT